MVYIGPLQGFGFPFEIWINSVEVSILDRVCIVSDSESCTDVKASKPLAQVCRRCRIHTFLRLQTGPAGFSFRVSGLCLIDSSLPVVFMVWLCAQGTWGLSERGANQSKKDWKT